MMAFATILHIYNFIWDAKATLQREMNLEQEIYYLLFKVHTEEQ